MDLTESGRHTLSHARKEVLSRMAATVEITAYARKDSNLRQAIGTIVGRYQRLKSNMTLHFLNTDTDPDEKRNSGHYCQWRTYASLSGPCGTCQNRH